MVARKRAVAIAVGPVNRQRIRGQGKPERFCYRVRPAFPCRFEMRSIAVLLGLSLTLPIGAQDHGSHEHGVSTLDLAIDTNRLSAVLQGPAHNFVGFEHLPEGEAERVRVEAARSALSDGEALLGMPEAAGCQQQRLEMEGVPEAWADVDKAADAAAGGHRHWRIEYRFLCEQADGLQYIEPRLFTAFKYTSELRWQLISGSHQDGGSLQTPGGRIGLLPAR